MFGCQMSDTNRISGGELGKSSGNFSVALKKPPSLWRQGVGWARGVSRVGEGSTCREESDGPVLAAACACARARASATHYIVPGGPTIMTSHEKRLSPERPTEMPSGGDFVISVERVVV